MRARRAAWSEGVSGTVGHGNGDEGTEESEESVSESEYIGWNSYLVRLVEGGEGSRSLLGCGEVSSSRSGRILGGEGIRSLSGWVGVRRCSSERENSWSTPSRSSGPYAMAVVVRGGFLGQ